jgi:predicted DNA-binding transcriptional regulator YafY
VGLRTAAGASVSGIEDASVRALVKLEQVLPKHLRRRVGALGSATVTMPVPGPTVDPQHLTVLAGACRDSECLRFAYTARDGAGTRRVVEPHSLVNRGRRWYLVAWDQGREDWRTFRVDRLTRPLAAGPRFQPRKLPVRDAAAFVERSIASAPSRFEARVVLHCPIEELSGRVGPHWGTLEPVDERTCSLVTGDDDLHWLAVRIGMLGVDFEVYEPPELIEELRSLASRLAAALP